MTIKNREQARALFNEKGYYGLLNEALRMKHEQQSNSPCDGSTACEFGSCGHSGPFCFIKLISIDSERISEYESIEKSIIFFANKDAVLIKKHSDCGKEEFEDKTDIFKNK